jgi:signal peptidase I
MEPQISANDLLIVKKTNFNALDIGDKIAYKTITDKIVTHEIIDVRVNESGTRSYVTKGTNTESKDTRPVTIDGSNNTNTYIGKLAHKSSVLGKAFAFMRSPVGLLAIIINIICFGLLTLYRKKHHIPSRQASARGTGTRVR